MTKDELLEALLVERHLPLPPSPKAGIPYDHPKDQHARRTALLEEIDEFEKDPGRKRPSEDDAPRFVRRGAILVSVKEDAA